MACKQEDFYVAYDHCIECARKEICRMCGLWADTNKELITVKNERDLLLAMPEGWEWRRPGAIGWCAFNEFGEYSGCSTPRHRRQGPRPVATGGSVQVGREGEDAMKIEIALEPANTTTTETVELGRFFVQVDGEFRGAVTCCARIVCDTNQIAAMQCCRQLAEEIEKTVRLWHEGKINNGKA